MKQVFIILLFVIMIGPNVHGQEAVIPSADSSDYYYNIPGYPESYSAENVAARLVDGLGFRFYWASEGLRQADLDYKPSAEGRTTAETIDHILGLSFTIINATTSTVNESRDRSGMSIAEKRNLALENIRKASENLKSAKAGDIESMRSIFKRDTPPDFELPFWNMVNGPIADAIYHSGQVTTFRRSSGNPIRSGISMFRGAGPR